MLMFDRIVVGLLIVSALINLIAALALKYHDELELATWHLLWAFISAWMISKVTD